MLGTSAILEAMAEGKITIDPFSEAQLGSNSYDLRVGEWIVRQRPGIRPSVSGLTPQKVFRLMDPINGGELWSEPEKAPSGIIRVRPGELILASTAERVGCFGDIVGEMSSRSSLMRCGIAVCVDAGLGDIGFDSRWTMEIFNHTEETIIEFDVGSRIAQMKFHRVEGANIEGHRTYQSKGGTYGVASDDYNPFDMIPRSNIS